MMTYQEQIVQLQSHGVAGAAFTDPTVNVSDTITVTEDDGSATVSELKLESALYCWGNRW